MTDGKGRLTKKTDTEVDYEDKSSYSLTVVARSRRAVVPATTPATYIDKYARVSVTIKVYDDDDDGEVTLMQREPQVGRTLSADVSDPDGDVTNVAWQWFRLTTAAFPDTAPTASCPAEAVGDSSCKIDKATSASYTPTQYDYHADGRYLAAQAEYNDKFNEGNTKTDAAGVSDTDVQKADAANTAPEFKDQDRNVPGDQTESVTREVAENTKADKIVGIEGFTATDADGDLLMYALTGADADSFQLSDPTRTGNTVELRTKAALDYETKTTYMVTITATDPSGASDSIDVTVNVTDVNEGAAVSTTRYGGLRGERHGHGGDLRRDRPRG